MKRVPVTQHAPLANDRVTKFAGEREYLATGSVSDDGVFSPELVTFESRPSRADLLVRSGDVCFARMQGTKKVFEVHETSAEAILSTGFAVLRPDSEFVNSGFLRRWVASDAFQSAKDRLCTGATQKAITNAKMKTLTIPLPALAEQKRIAEILDAADALRVTRRESLAQLDTLLQSTFFEMFGDKGTPISIGKMLSDGTLDLHKDGNHGGLYPRAHEFGASGIPFLSAKCISKEGDLLLEGVQFLDEEKARTLKLGWIEDGDVLLAHNASVGKTFLYHGEFEEALIGTSLTAFRPNPRALDSAYLLGALRSQGFQQQLFANMGQTTRNQVPITAQRRLSIPLPPLDLQRRFAAIVESVEQQKARQRAHLAELDTLFASLRQRAFNGELSA